MATNNRLETNLNVPPYYDDYDPNKKYYRILFRPSVAVQARELTQIQTIIQEQIRRFANYTFKDGSIIDGCDITYLKNFDYVHLVDNFSSGNIQLPSNITSDYLITNSTDSNTAVRAVSLISVNGYEANYPETNRFYLKYIKSGVSSAGTEQKIFLPGETLYIYSPNQDKLGTLDPNNLVATINIMNSSANVNPIGKGYGITVGDGIIYQKGFFLNVDKHTIIVNPFSTDPSGYVIGFITKEEIIYPEQDESLLDPANGAPNYKAPGAHRLKLTATLVARKKDEIGPDENFFPIVEFDSNEPTQQNTGEEILAKLREVFAKRTYEESGNYVVKPFTAETVPADTADKFTYEISPGIAYVNGFRVEKLNTFRIVTDRATKTDEVQSEIISINYGNYVYANELVGLFDHKTLERVYLYDTAQKANSQYEGVAAPTGNIIGEANVRMVKYDTGRKGAWDCVYKIYLTNIKMYVGHSFSEVKSIVNSTYTAKADIILENGIAVLKESDRKTLLFDFGLNAIKRLRDKNGVNDTQYIVRDIVSATLAVDGTVTFTLNTPPNGGNEKINAGIGLLSEGQEEDFDIILTQEAYTADLPGTVDISTGTTTITGSGTTFFLHFKPNDYIYIIGANGNYVRRVVSVISDTQITIDAAITGETLTTATYKKYYPAGHIVDLSGADKTINVISDTQFTIDTNLDLNVGNLASGTQTVKAYIPVLRSQATEAKKVIKKNRFVKIDVSTHPNGTTGPWNLGFVDVHKIRHIYVGTTFADTNPDRLNWFVIDNGQRDDIYEQARIIIKPQFKDKITSATKILVELDYFDVDTTTGIGFFSVDSYPVDDTTTSTTTIKTAEIPIFKSLLTGKKFDLRNCVDFRARRNHTAVDATDIASASINPADDDTSIVVFNNTTHVAEADTNFQADIEYYLPRIDLICATPSGDIIIRKGEPSLIPVPPKDERDSYALIKAYITPYPSLTTREAEDYNRFDLEIKTEFIGTKRYRMVDIDAINKRLKRVEYYTALNVLEQKTKDMIIPDENGLDRFKNGIYADNFQSHLGGKVEDIEYSIAIDKDKGIARPYFKTRPIDFKYDIANSVGLRKQGSWILLDYTDEKFIEQKYATKYRNCTANFWHWNGRVYLYPSYDHYRDEKYTPAVNITLDLTKPWREFANSPFGTVYGDWRVIEETSETYLLYGFNPSVITDNYQITETTTISERFVHEMSIDTTSETYNIGNTVNDFSISPYMRSRIIAVIAYSMRPSTRMHIFFDGVNVDQYCAPATLSGKTEVEVGKEHEILDQTGNWGDPIYSDENGNVYCLFKIPEKTFRVGDRVLLVTDIDNLDLGNDAQLTAGRATYTASNISVTKNQMSITTINPDIVTYTTTQQKTEVSETRVYIPAPPPEDDTWGGGDASSLDGEGSGASVGGCGCEPIAQTFLVKPNEGNLPGLFINKIGVYFKKKDPNLGCTLFLTETSVGYPNAYKIIAQKHLNSADILVSDDATLETIFEFDQPVFLNRNTEYAFIIYPDGNSPNYEIWCSKLGDFDIITNKQIFRQPNVGVMFVSANMTAWTSIQEEDLKFNVYRCVFNSQSGTAYFENEDDDYFIVDGFTKSNATNRIEVGDLVYKQVNGNVVTDTTSPDYAFGRVQFVDEGTNELIIDGSNGNFNAGDTIEIHRSSGGTISSSTLIATATIQTIENPEYNAIVPRFADIVPSMTNLQYSFKGTDALNNLDVNWRKVKNDYDTEILEKPLYIISKSNQTSADKSAKYKIDFTSYSKYLSPIIDLKRKASLIIKNIINNDTTNEHLRTGNALTKYVSINVTLSDDLGPAEDMIALVSAYRPVGTDIKVYVKVLASEDGDPFDDKLWTEMPMTPKSKSKYSSPFDVNDYIEYEFNMPTEIQHTVGNQTTAWLENGIVTYKRKDGAQVYRFKTFCFKIVLTSESSHKVPRLNDFRAIALQK